MELWRFPAFRVRKHSTLADLPTLGSPPADVRNRRSRYPADRPCGRIGRESRAPQGFALGSRAAKPTGYAPAFAGHGSPCDGAVPLIPSQPMIPISAALLRCSATTEAIPVSMKKTCSIRLLARFHGSPRGCGGANIACLLALARSPSACIAFVVLATTANDPESMSRITVAPSLEVRPFDVRYPPQQGKRKSQKWLQFFVPPSPCRSF